MIYIIIYVITTFVNWMILSNFDSNDNSQKNEQINLYPKVSVKSYAVIILNVSP